MWEPAAKGRRPVTTSFAFAAANVFTFSVTRTLPAAVPAVARDGTTGLCNRHIILLHAFVVHTVRYRVLVLVLVVGH